jgi:hypothetical protein
VAKKVKKVVREKQDTGKLLKEEIRFDFSKEIFSAEYYWNEIQNLLERMNVIKKGIRAEEDGEYGSPSYLHMAQLAAMLSVKSEEFARGLIKDHYEIITAGLTEKEISGIRMVLYKDLFKRT